MAGRAAAGMGWRVGSAPHLVAALEQVEAGLKHAHMRFNTAQKHLQQCIAASTCRQCWLRG